MQNKEGGLKLPAKMTVHVQGSGLGFWILYTQAQGDQDRTIQ